MAKKYSISRDAITSGESNRDGCKVEESSVSLSRPHMKAFTVEASTPGILRSLAAVRPGRRLVLCEEYIMALARGVFFHPCVNVPRVEDDTVPVCAVRNFARVLDVLGAIDTNCQIIR